MNLNITVVQEVMEGSYLQVNERNVYYYNIWHLNLTSMTVKQIANVAALPGIVKRSIGLPDVHSGYGFAIGNVAAFDVDNPESIVSPGGVGFDINCGVRLLRTNLTEADVVPVQEQLAQSLFDHIPVGVGSKGVIPTSAADLDAALEMGMDWSVREGHRRSP